MSEKVKVGFIGAGNMANKVHYPSLYEMEDVEIVGICDINEKRLFETADKYKIKNRFNDYKEMLDKISLDAVYVIMEGHLIYDIVKECLNRKLNVFIEKPPGITLYQVETLANLSVKKNCKTMVGFNRRYIPLLREVKKMVEEKGKIIQCVATFYKDIKTGLSYEENPIDILTHDAIHCVDTLRFLGGEVKKVKSVVKKFYCGVYNSFNGIIEFENGTVGILITNWAVAKRIHIFEIHSKGISAFIDASVEPKENKAIIYETEREEPKIIYGKDISKSEQLYKLYGYFQENRYFINCIKENKEPETSFVDAVKTMELIERIYRDGKTD